MANWSMWEPLEAEQPPPMAYQAPQFSEPPPVQPQQMPNQFHAGGDSLPQQPHQAQAPPKQYPTQTKNVPIPPPSQPVGGSKWQDVSDYYQLGDWVYLLVAAVLVEVSIVGLVRFFPYFFGKYINLYYNRFKLEAIVSDVFILLVGFGIARYIYTDYIYPTYDWNPAYFTGLSVLVQVIHDVLFYFGVIKQVPEGANSYTDMLKEYANETGAKSIVADSGMMIGTSILSMLLKAAPGHLIAFVFVIAMYVLPYFLETRNMYSGMA